MMRMESHPDYNSFSWLLDRSIPSSFPIPTQSQQSPLTPLIPMLQAVRLHKRSGLTEIEESYERNLMKKVYCLQEAQHLANNVLNTN